MSPKNALNFMTPLIMELQSYNDKDGDKTHFI